MQEEREVQLAEPAALLVSSAALAALAEPPVVLEVLEVLLISLAEPLVVPLVVLEAVRLQEVLPEVLKEHLAPRAQLVPPHPLLRVLQALLEPQAPQVRVLLAATTPPPLLQALALVQPVPATPKRVLVLQGPQGPQVPVRPSKELV